MRLVNINISLEIYSIIISIILARFIRRTRQKDNVQNLFFMWMLIVNCFIMAGDMCDWCLSGRTDLISCLLNRAGAVVYYTGIPCVLYGFINFVGLYNKKKDIVVQKCILIGRGLVIIQAAVSVLSLFTGWYFTFDENNNYLRGNIQWLSAIVPLLFWIACSIAIIQTRNDLNKYERRTLNTFMVMSIVSYLYQQMHYGIALTPVAITVALLIIFTDLLTVREIKMRRQQQELKEMQVDMMISQIQPHFLYNTLTAIRALCEKDPKKAQAAIYDLSRYLRANMNSITSKTPIMFSKELEHVENYLNLEKTRFGERIKITYDVDVTDFRIPPLCLQPLVENAVKHGITKRDEGGSIHIHTYEDDKDFMIDVSDDGVGFDVAKYRQGLEGSHVGLSNVESRLRSQSEGYLVISSIIGERTTITVHIPKIAKNMP